MTTTLTPPPAGTPAPTEHPPTRGSSRVVAILVIVFGALVIIGAIFSAVVSTVVAATVHTTTRSVDASGVTDLGVDVAAGSLRIEYADISEAELQVTSTSGADRWTLTNDNGTLTVASPQGRFADGWLFSGWLFGVNDVGDATLRLPQTTAGADAALHLAAGNLTIVDGSFGRVGLEMGAGTAHIGATVHDITADVSAGTAELNLDGARTANLTVSAGSLQARLSGSQPDTLKLDVSAGSLDVAVPAGDYRVTSDVSAGSFDNRVGSTPDASSTVTVQVSAGTATLSEQ